MRASHALAQNAQRALVGCIDRVPTLWLVRRVADDVITDAPVAAWQTRPSLAAPDRVCGIGHARKKQQGRRQAASAQLQISKAAASAELQQRSCSSKAAAAKLHQQQVTAAEMPQQQQASSSSAGGTTIQVPPTRHSPRPRHDTADAVLGCSSQHSAVEGVTMHSRVISVC